MIDIKLEYIILLWGPYPCGVYPGYTSQQYPIHVVWRGIWWTIPVFPWSIKPWIYRFAVGSLHYISDSCCMKGDLVNNPCFPLFTKAPILYICCGVPTPYICCGALIHALIGRPGYTGMCVAASVDFKPSNRLVVSHRCGRCRGEEKLERRVHWSQVSYCSY